MSASREKRARQADTTIGEKKRAIQEQEAAAKRKTRLYAAIGAVIAVAAAALVVWDSGIFQRNTVAATINGVDYTTAEVDYYYNMTKNQFVSTAQAYAQYGMDVGYDFSKAPAEQVFSTNEETGEVTEPPMPSLSISGIDVSEFTIVYSNSAENGEAELAALLSDRIFGFLL